MPERNGRETLDLIDQVSDVPVIMLTGSDSELERVRGLKAGADDYIGKPYGAPELLARIEAVLCAGRRASRTSRTCGRATWCGSTTARAR
jgi:DNA-binding response OmpR family regulator